MSIRIISGVMFERKDGIWLSRLNGMKLVLNHEPGFKCSLLCEDDGNGYHFQSVVAANNFAKRKKHGRTLAEHIRAECLVATMERLGLDVENMAWKLGISPRTIEAYSSGVRAVPASLFKKLDEL